LNSPRSAKKVVFQKKFYFEKTNLNRSFLYICEREFVFDVVFVNDKKVAIRLVAAVVAVDDRVAFLLLEFV
jgi:hypothetical protein